MNNIENPKYQEMENSKRVIDNKYQESLEREQASEKEIAKEEEKLKFFSEILGDCEYYIGGGLGVELIEGAIKHKHQDVDIIVFEDAIAKVKKNLKSKGFTITKEKNFAGHDLDARNIKDIEESNEPHKKETLYIGIFIYKKNTEKETAQHLNDEGNITLEFPLAYFNKENQTIDYKNNKLMVSDLRLIAGLKIAYVREKDTNDIGRIKHIFKSNYTKKEIDEFIDVSKKNAETLFNEIFKYSFSDFLETNQQITGENINKYFEQDFKSKIMEIEDPVYAGIVKEVIVSLKDFSSNANDYKEIKNEFSVFVSKKLKPLIEYQKNRINHF